MKYVFQVYLKCQANEPKEEKRTWKGAAVSPYIALTRSIVIDAFVAEIHFEYNNFVWFVNGLANHTMNMKIDTY